MLHLTRHSFVPLLTHSLTHSRQAHATRRRGLRKRLSRALKSSGAVARSAKNLLSRGRSARDEAKSTASLGLKRGSRWVKLHRSALLTLVGSRIGFFLHRQPRSVLEEPLLFATVTAIRRSDDLRGGLRTRLWHAHRTEAPCRGGS